MYRINIGVHQVISCTIHHPNLASSTDWQIDRLIPVDVPLVCCWLLVWQHKAGIQGRGRHDWFAGRQHSDTLPAFTVSRSVSFQSCLSLVLLSVCCLHWSLHLYSCTSEASPWMQCDTVTARNTLFHLYTSRKSHTGMPVIAKNLLHEIWHSAVAPPGDAGKTSSVHNHKPTDAPV